MDQIFRDYKGETNMSCESMKNWAKDRCSFEASLNREPTKRNIRLLCKPKSRWTDRDHRDAKKAISYLKRAKKIKSSKIVSGCGRTKNSIALKNWGFDDSK